MSAARWIIAAQAVLIVYLVIFTVRVNQRADENERAYIDALREYMPPRDDDREKRDQSPHR